MTDRLKRKKQKFNEVQDRYINCDFIIGSVAEVERLWLLAKYILADTRKSTSPLAFEAIIVPEGERELLERAHRTIGYVSCTEPTCPASSKRG